MQGNVCVYIYIFICSIVYIHFNKYKPYQRRFFTTAPLFTAPRLVNFAAKVHKVQQGLSGSPFTLALTLELI